jgi:sugar transferase (PEP-CTERM/EpsH1 system associated)
MKPINVLHLIQGLKLGGLENVTLDLLNNLNKDHYKPSICCFDTLGDLSNRINGNIKVHFLKRRQGIDYFYPFKLAKLLKKKKIQILHLHNSTAFFYGVIAGKLAGIPAIVYTEHARDVFPGFRVRVADKLLSYFTDKIIVVADYLKKNLIKHEKFNEKKISVIYNGIDSGEFNISADRQKKRKELDIDIKAPVVGIVARLDPIKNHACLIKAMKNVINKYPDALLLIVGDGPINSELKEMVKDMALEKNIRFLGMRTDVHEILSVMDVFVLCSRSEGLSVTLLEAMSSGKAVVATRVGGTPELIEHDMEGLLVESDDREGLSGAILELLTHRSKAAKLGETARRKVEEQFSLVNMVKKYEEIYMECLPHYEGE